MERQLTPQEVADHLGVSKLTVLNLLKLKKLVGYKLGARTIRIPVSSLHHYLEKVKIGGFKV